MSGLGPIIEILKFLFMALFMGGTTVEEVTATGPEPVAAPLSPDEVERIDADLDSLPDLPPGLGMPPGEQ